MMRVRFGGLRISGVQRRSVICPTVPLWELQHRDQVLGTHGAGLITHQSMSKMNLGPNTPRFVSQAAPAADLFYTTVHEGLGTGEKDPYIRTLPNRTPSSPEPTVMQATAPTIDEVQTLEHRWGSIQYWLGDHHPRLPLYIKQLVVSTALPVSAVAEKLLEQFASTVIPEIMKDRDPSDREELSRLWQTAVKSYGALNSERALDREGFVRQLDELHQETTAAMQSIAAREEVALALEALYRKAILKRNAFLLDMLLPIFTNGPFLSFGDALWRVFFQAVERHRSSVLQKEDGALIRFAWESLHLEDVVRTPAMTAPVALFFALVCILEAKVLSASDNSDSVMWLDDKLGSSVRRPRRSFMHLVDPMLKRQFVIKSLQDMLSDAPGCSKLAKALRASGRHDLSREAFLCEAMHDNKLLLESDVKDVVGRFEEVNEVRTVLSSIMGGADDAARRHVASTLGISSTGPLNWGDIMVRLDWGTNWRPLATALLSDKSTLAAAHKHIKNAVGAKGATRHLISEAYAEELHKVIQLRVERDAAKQERTQYLVSQLSSHHEVHTTLELLQALGVDMTEIQNEAQALEQACMTTRPIIELSVLEAALRAVARRHPNWVKSGVLPSTPRVQDHIAALECAVRIFVRLAYVPQAGAAAIAQRTRRRIGPIGKNPHEHNIPAELGFVEQYDNLQYKRYDWQGWYQRMVDVHNRNVSLRCRIDDLKRLDARGNPFLDLQTERRLRILAGDRVGMGVLKLDSDRYEDQSDNVTYGSTKISELLADARKAQLGPEYWPTVEVKVRRPSGQSRMHYSLVDNERIEKRSTELYEKYREAKKLSLFVTPMDLWLDISGMQVRNTADTADADGYTLDSLQDTLTDGGDDAPR